MQNLTNIEINTVASGADSPASFFRSAAAQRIHEENQKLYHNHNNNNEAINVAAAAATCIFFVSIKVITTVIYTATMLVTLTYLCIKDTYIKNHHKSLH